MPFERDWPLPYIVSVNLLKTISFGSGVTAPRLASNRDSGRSTADAHARVTRPSGEAPRHHHPVRRSPLTR
jgi:hypothetical protein